jgi:hypothetical protein
VIPRFDLIFDSDLQFFPGAEAVSGIARLTRLINGSLELKRFQGLGEII